MIGDDSVEPRVDGELRPIGYSGDASSRRRVRRTPSLPPALLLAANALVALAAAVRDGLREPQHGALPLQEAVAIALSLAALWWLWRHRHDLGPRMAEGARARRMMSAVETNAQELLWEATADGVISYASPHVPEFLGYHPDELIGRHLNVVLAERERPRAAELFRTSAATGQGWHDELFIFTSKSGFELPLRGTGVVHVGGDGRVVGFTGSLRHPDGEQNRGEHLARSDRIGQIIRDRAVSVVFQPIVDLATGAAVGAEALARITTDPGMSPDRCFAEAAGVGLAVELELLAVERALEGARLLPADLHVGLNISPATLLDPRLRAMLDAAHAEGRRLVVELTEHVSVDDYRPVNAAADALRRQGLLVAVDDTGAGYASLRHVLKLRPDIIKLDRALITGIDVDPAQRAVVRAVVLFAGELGARVVAEGIETAQQAVAARSLGVPHAQGYLFGRPAAPGAEWASRSAAWPGRS